MSLILGSIGVEYQYQGSDGVKYPVYTQTNLKDMSYFNKPFLFGKRRLSNLNRRVRVGQSLPSYTFKPAYI